MVGFAAAGVASLMHSRRSTPATIGDSSRFSTPAQASATRLLLLGR